MAASSHLAPAANAAASRPLIVISRAGLAAAIIVAALMSAGMAAQALRGAGIAGLSSRGDLSAAAQAVSAHMDVAPTATASPPPPSGTATPCPSAASVAPTPTPTPPPSAPTRLIVLSTYVPLDASKAPSDLTWLSHYLCE